MSKLIAPEDRLGVVGSSLPARVKLELIDASVPDSVAEEVAKTLNSIEQVSPDATSQTDETVAKHGELIPETVKCIESTMRNVNFRTFCREFLIKIIAGDATIEEFQTQLRDYLQKTFEENPLVFLELLEYYSSQDWYELFVSSVTSAVEEKGADAVENYFKGSQLLAPLKMERAIFLTAIEIVRDLRNTEDWQNFIRQHLPPERVKKVSDALLKLNSAGLPDLMPVIKRFEAFVAEFMRDDELPIFQNQPYKKHDAVKNCFKTQAKELYGTDYELFYTHGGMDGLSKLIARVYDQKPNTVFLLPKHEYLPVFYSIHEGNRFMIPDPQKGQTAEDAILEEARRKVNDVDNTVDIVLIVSSVPRDGTQKIDVDYLDAQLKQIPDHDRIKLWVDASQDGNNSLKGDVIVRSKRVGGTGGGVVQIRKDYLDEPFDIAEKLKIRSGFPTNVIARCIGSMYCAANKYGHEVADLLRSPTIWLYRGKGGYLTEELNKGREYFEGSEVLQQNIELLDHSRLGQTTSAEEIISMRVTEESNLDIVKIADELRKLKVDFTVFNLRQALESHPDGIFTKVIALLSTGDLDQTLDRVEYDEIRRMLVELEKYFSDWALHSFSLEPISADKEIPTKADVLSHINSEMRRNTAIRIIVKTVDKPDSVVEFFRRLESTMN